MNPKSIIFKIFLVYFAICYSRQVPASEVNTQQGEISVLTYNIAGLPDWISKSTPSINIPIISPLINQYDIVLIQEDFEFHEALDLKATHAYRSMTMMKPLLLNTDGLNRYAKKRFIDFTRIRWNDCHGYFRAANDCLAHKGFTLARHEIAQDLYIDIYNLHADAGRHKGDKESRQKEFSQLEEFISIHSKGNALIIGGDTNLKSTDKFDEINLLEFLESTNTTVVARELNQLPDLIDRIMYRSSSELTLSPERRYIAPEFIDRNNDPLSDHPALVVEFSWHNTKVH
ncbi:MAG: endonuclease/exonuclease/phosphatase family protein [Pseudomonadales bacterium]|nr:endonuclease/exonuclease/phosphatase family protein [Pseudomonadales bacterium]